MEFLALSLLLERETAFCAAPPTPHPLHILAGVDTLKAAPDGFLIVNNSAQCVMKKFNPYNRTNYPITARVCKYVMDQKDVSARDATRMLDIHHSTWQRYLKGVYRPSDEVKKRLVRMMRFHSFRELVDAAHSIPPKPR